MSGNREELQRVLCHYTKDTLSDIDTVRGFCEIISKWRLGRETELDMMKDIKDRADKINLNLSHVTNAKRNIQAMWQHVKNRVTLGTADSRRAGLEKELAAVLEDTMRGLEELNCFLDAVEKLAVTSLHVFMKENQVLHLPKGISLQQVQLVIIAARLICPLLLEFKRDARVFFLPKLQNIEVLSYQLDKYVQTTQEICEMFEKSSVGDFHLKMNKETQVDLDVDLSEDDIQKMLCHINQLDEIRMEEPFRMVFLFQDVSCSDFINEFRKRQPRMLQFLDELEESAVQLDKMNKGARISSVAGSSVGAIAGVLSIVGLALIPVTAGVSLGLTIGGTVLGITSGVNSIATTATEIKVNHTQQEKANGVFQSFMEDVQILQDCLEEVTSQTVTKIEGSKIDVAVGVIRVINKVRAVGQGIDSLVDAVSAVKVVGHKGHTLGNVAADLPDIGQAAAKGPLALSQSARAGFLGLNALFLGMDILFICKDSVTLSKGSETYVSKFFRARAALWSSEMDSWKKIHDSLCEGLQTSEKHRAVLENPFYPRRQTEETDTKNEISTWSSG